MSVPQRPDVFERLNKMTEDALSQAASHRVISTPNASTQNQPKTPDPRRVATTPSNLPLPQRRAQLTHGTENESVQQDSIGSSMSLLGIPEPPQATPEPSPVEAYLARRATRNQTKRPSSSTDGERTNSTSDSSPLEKAIDSFTKKVRTSDTFEQLSEDWDEVDTLLQTARDPMQGEQLDQSPTVEELIQRLRDLDDDDSVLQDRPSPLFVRKRKA